MASSQSQSKQHWIPAAFLGGFSVDADRPRLRDRRLWVKEAGCSTSAVYTAKNLGYERGMYDMSDETIGAEPEAFDRTFNAYERKLPSAILKLTDSLVFDFSFEVWMKVLVPFLAGLAVRGPDFGDRLSFPNVEIQTSRWMEMTRLLAPLMAAEWSVLVAPASARLITNDRGFCWAQDQTGRAGLLVPVRPTCALRVMPRTQAAIARKGPAGWTTWLPRIDLASADVDSINDHIALSALRWIAGPEKVDVDGREPGCVTGDMSPFAGGWWPDRGRLGMHDMDWAAALKLTGLSADPDDWHPLGILSSGEPGVRVVETKGETILTIAFA
jgi:hypothetical protein